MTRNGWKIYHPQMVYGIGFTNIIYISTSSIMFYPQAMRLARLAHLFGRTVKDQIFALGARAAMDPSPLRLVQTPQREVDSSQDS